MFRKKEKPISICLNALMLQDHLGGIGTYAYQLALNLTKTHPEWKISLLVHTGASELFRDIPGLDIIEIGITSRVGRLLFLHFIFPFRATRFSVFHSVGNMGLDFSNARQVITIHDAYEHTSPERFGRFKRTLMKWLISRSGRKAKAIITDSQNSARDIKKYYPELAGKVSVVYLGNKFPVENCVEEKTREGFIFVGTIEPGKNLALVLEAFASYLRSHTGRLTVIGAMGWKQSTLPDRIRALGIADHVEFLGYISDDQLKDLYSRSLALIQPSNYEGFGLPVIEAMACGCPVIAARNSGLIEAGGESAIFFETNDKVGLLAGMMAVKEDLALRERCLRSGFIHAAGFSWEKTATQTAAIYDKIIGIIT